MKLKSKVAVITGAGRGIGKAIALAFAHEGANLVLVSRTLTEVETSRSEVHAMGGRALAVTADVSCRKDVDAIVSAALAEFGRADILVNNAGVQPPIGPLWENDPMSG